jgi:PAS domain-containing protein
VLPPKLASDFAKCFQRVVEGKGLQVHEYSVWFDGEERWFEARIVGTEDNILSVVRDVTGRKRAMIELRASEERFSKAFHRNPQPMSITTVAEGRYLDVNDSFLVMSGYSREEVIGRTSLELRVWDSPEK